MNDECGGALEPPLTCLLLYVQFFFCFQFRIACDGALNKEGVTRVTRDRDRL